ncbi:MAG: single-stranded DNA-binding protein [Phenylobacterium sp.]|uniref:single-stranded DNA-binding protein n=1 Tax=Phenylobacterium sp. TaxID=1871053 RepID=UPI00391C07B4
MQTVTVEGYLAADPSILTAQGSGKKRASFRLVETARFRRGDGQPGERTTGFNCICFNEAAAEGYIGPYARKGSRVVVSGHVENDSWTGQDGVVHYDLRLVVEQLRIKARRPDQASGQEPAADAAGDFDEEEIPF